MVQAGEVRSSRIESLRALAALGVLVSHVYGAFVPPVGHDTVIRRVVSTGAWGVFLFFALTGYLLFWPFVKRAAEATTRLDLGRYVRNRIVRIVPLYYFVLIVLMIAQQSGGSATQWLHFLTFTQNFSHATILTVDDPMWSLGIEVEFYALIPLLALAMVWLARGSINRIAAGIGALALISYAVYVAKVQVPARPSLLWKLSLPTTFFYFVAGMLLALVRLRWQERPPAWIAGPLGRASVWLSAGVAAWLVTAMDPDYNVVAIPVASFLIIGACVLPLRASPGTRALEWRPLAVLGMASYGIYLWNSPIVNWFARHGLPWASWRLLGASLSVCCAVALVTYVCVEAPFLRLRRRWAVTEVREDRAPSRVAAPVA